MEVKKFFSFLNVFSFLTDDIFSNDCFVQRIMPEDSLNENYFAKIMINYLVPILISFSCLILYVLKSCLAKTLQKFKQNAQRKPHRSAKHKLYTLSLIAIFLFYPLLTKCSLSLINCIKIDQSDRFYLYANPNFECWSSSHFIYFFALGLSGITIFGIGYPFFLCYKIKNHRITFLNKKPFSYKISQATAKKKILRMNFNKKICRKSNSLIKSQMETEISRIYRFFYKDYKNEYYYWETGIFIQKFILTLLKNLNQTIDQEVQNFCFISVLLLILLLWLR